VEVTQPRFSVIVPTFNRPEQLSRLLAALAASDYASPAFEVLVVDDAGSESLDLVTAQFAGRLDVKLIRNAVNHGPAHGRNTGAANAKNEFLAFTDDDCEPATGWLSALARRFVESPECLVGGRTVNGLNQNPYSSASQLIIDLVYAFYNSDPEGPRFFASNNLAVRADLFRQCGKFDESFRTSEDREFCNRWLQHNLRMEYEQDAIVVHRHPLSFRTFWEQHFSYGQGAARFHRVCAQRDSGRLSDHFGFHRKLPRSWWLSTRNLPNGQRVKTIPLLLLWQAANGAGFLNELWRPTT